MLITNKLPAAPAGGRELLCKLNHDALREIYCDRLTVFELARKSIRGFPSIFSAFRGHIDVSMAETIAANRLGNVIALNIAASDHAGEVSISDGENFLSNSIVGAESAVRIRARVLDDVLSEIGATCSDLIKMNIEGAETDALRGMEATLRVASHVVVSCHDFIADNHGGDPAQRTYDDVNRTLRDAGYMMRARREGGCEELRYYVYGGK